MTEIKKKASPKDPVAVFDSGLGGISVVREVRRLLPQENIVYFGDSLHAPYGTKEKSEVIRLCENTLDMLLEKNAKCVIIACNTATSAAAQYLREKYPLLPIIGMEPAVKPAAKSSPRPRVLVLATPVTISGGKLHHLIEAYEDEADFSLLPAPELVSFVESGISDKNPSKELYDYLKKLFSRFPKDANESFDAVVLGCTHFPFVKESILKALGSDIPVFDGALGTAMQTERKLAQLGLLNMSKAPGEILLLNSDESKIPLEKMLLEY